jgi:nicotinamide-nucleotide amidase
VIFPDEMRRRAQDLLDAYQAADLKIVTAESCTGGLIAALLTDIPGSSKTVERGFVTYSNEAKIECLGVPPETIAAHGAVSEATARAMADGGLAASRADVAVSVTGVAGPGGGSAEKPVGLVHFGLARRGRETRGHACRYGDLGRSMVRLRTLADALGLLEEALRADAHVSAGR